MNPKRTFLAAATMTAAATLQLIGAGAASASVPGLTIVHTESSISSVHNRSVTTFCPAGTKVLSAAAEELGPEGQRVVLEDITPLPDLSGVNAVATEVFGGSQKNWAVVATAVCAKPLPGLQLVSASSVVNSQAKAATVFCPPGKDVMGTGGQINVANSGRVFLDEITPLPNLSGVTVVGAEAPAGEPGNWTVKAYAICANAGQPGLQLVSASSAIDSEHAKVADAFCPAGKRVIGSGSQVNTPDTGFVALDMASPMDSLTSVKSIAVERPQGEPSNWTVKTYAICAYL